MSPPLYLLSGSGRGERAGGHKNIVFFDDVRIPFQVVHGYEIEGSGSLFHDELSLSYRVKDLYDHSISDYCETVAWR